MTENRKLDYEGLPILTGVQPDHHGSYLNNFEDRYGGNLFEKLDCIAGDIINDIFNKRYVALQEMERLISWLVCLGQRY